MSRRNYSLRVNRDGTVTFKSGRYVEHIDIRWIGYLETYERLKLAALSAGFSLSQSTLEELLKEARGLKGELPPKSPAGKKLYVRVDDEQVLRFLTARGERTFTRIDEISTRFNISMATARRKLDRLCAEGRIEKDGTHYRALKMRRDLR